MQERSQRSALRNQWRLLTWLTALLIVKVNVETVLNYRDYFPPDFSSNFLQHRESYFFGSYQWAFWLHIVSGPFSLLLGMLLISTTFRLKFPGWHRRIGRVQVAVVLLGLVPSGLWLSFYAAAGPLAGIGLALLSLLTGGSLLLGFLAAIRKKFATHRRWMLRHFTLLCSAVVLRLISGTATLLEYGPGWFDPLAIWISWLVPTLILEWNLQRKSRHASLIPGN